MLCLCLCIFSFLYDFFARTVPQLPRLLPFSDRKCSVCTVHTHINIEINTTLTYGICFCLYLWAWSLREQPINNPNITNSCWYYSNYEVHYLDVHCNIVNTVKYVHIFSQCFPIHSFHFSLTRNFVMLKTLFVGVGVAVTIVVAVCFGFVWFALVWVCLLRMPSLHTIS